MASNRLRKVNKGDQESARMDMSPMIDMVFLLLLFFLVVSTPKTIKIDPKVKPPIASAAKVPKDKYGKIVINIYEDGTLATEGSAVLETDESIKEYITKSKESIDRNGNTPKLHFRGHQDTVFKHCRRAIRIGANVGVVQVTFGAFIVGE